MENKAIRIINKLISLLIIVLTGLIPLFFLPFTYDFYEFNKNTLLIAFVSVMLVVWLLRMALEKKITFRRTPIDLPVLILAGTFILSTIFVSTNKWETFWTPLGTGTIISLIILYFIITNNIKKAEVNKIINTLLVSAGLLVFLTLYQFIFLKLTNSSTSFPLKFLFPAGGLIPLATFLTVMLTLTGSTLIEQMKNRLSRSVKSVSLSVVSVSLIGIGLILTIWQLFTTSKPLLLPSSTSWTIAVETFKNWRLFLFGVGPTNFLDAFSQFRSLSYNLGPLWTIRFSFSSNYYFHLLTTVGILGLAALGWIIIKTIKTQIKQANFLFFPFLVILVIFAFVLPNFLILFSFFLLLALLFVSGQQNIKEYSKNSQTTAWIVLVVALFLVLGNLYLVGRAYAADVYFKKSIKAFAQNDGTAVYNNQIKATTLNPFDDNYRLAYSQTNLALASSLATKSDLTDQDRQNITVLVQQAIREAKMAVTLNKNKVTNWENLASIYRQLVNFAQGADQWAISALNQAIKLDPANPNLRLNLGGLYYALKNYDEAIRFFQQAVDIKPNFANGYYNLAAAYREKGDFQKAHDAMQMALNLVPTTSEDYNKARVELDDLAKKIPAQEATKEAELKTQPQPIPTQEPLIEPQPIPSPVIVPPIELPQE